MDARQTLWLEAAKAFKCTESFIMSPYESTIIFHFNSAFKNTESLFQLLDNAFEQRLGVSPLKIEICLESFPKIKSQTPIMLSFAKKYIYAKEVAGKDLSDLLLEIKTNPDSVFASNPKEDLRKESIPTKGKLLHFPPQ